MTELEISTLGPGRLDAEAPLRVHSTSLRPGARSGLLPTIPRLRESRKRCFLGIQEVPLNTACPRDSIPSRVGERPLEGARLSVLVRTGAGCAGLRCLQNPAEAVALLG